MYIEKINQLSHLVSVVGDGIVRMSNNTGTTMKIKKICELLLVKP